MYIGDLTHFCEMLETGSKMKTSLNSEDMASATTSKELNVQLYNVMYRIVNRNDCCVLL